MYHPTAVVKNKGCAFVFDDILCKMATNPDPAPQDAAPPLPVTRAEFDELREQLRRTRNQLRRTRTDLALLQMECATRPVPMSWSHCIKFWNIKGQWQTILSESFLPSFRMRSLLMLPSASTPPGETEETSMATSDFQCIQYSACYYK